MDHDDLTGIFDNLKPEDFLRTTTSATMEETKKQSDRTFDEFVQDQLRGVRYAFASADGQVNPLCTLANDTTERVFAAQDDELLRDYVNRLHDEAVAMDATWMFIFRHTTVGVFSADKAYDADSDEAIEVTDAETKREAIYWYAEDRTGDATWHRHGFLTIEDQKLGDLFEGNSMQKVNLFSHILDS